mgnify:FL=1|tara:strand:+ start:150 stop:350 length:201 start_codon:yes stop_codon:yes gene_type:complete
MQFPTFDLSNFQASRGVDRQVLSDRLDQICRETGFLLLSGHGVPQEIITAQWDVIDAFFSLPMEKK